MYQLYDMVYGLKWVPFTDAICRRWKSSVNYDGEKYKMLTFGEWHIGTGYGNYIGPNEDQIKITKCQEYAECSIDFKIDARITKSCEPFPDLNDERIYGCKR